jgi:hypothetical protein
MKKYMMQSDEIRRLTKMPPTVRAVEASYSTALIIVEITP